MVNKMGTKTFSMERPFNEAKDTVFLFNPKFASEAVRLYKSGKSVADLKRRYHTYGNPIVAALKEAKVFKAGRKVAKASGRKSGKVLNMPKRKRAVRTAHAAPVAQAA